MPGGGPAMNPWTLAGLLIGWLVVVAIIAAIVIAVVLVLYVIGAAIVKTVRDAHTPPPAPREPGTTDIMSGGGSDG